MAGPSSARSRGEERDTQMISESSVSLCLRVEAWSVSSVSSLSNASLPPNRRNRIQFRRAARGDQRRNRRDGREDHRNRDERQRIERGEAVEQAAEVASHNRGGGEPDHDPSQRKAQGFA